MYVTHGTIKEEFLIPGQCGPDAVLNGDQKKGISLEESH